MSPLMLLAAVLLLAGAAVVVLLSLRGDRDPAPQPALPPPGDPAPRLNRLLAHTGLASRLQWELVRAGVLLRPSELVAVALGAAALGWMLGFFLVKSALAGLLLAGVGLLGPWLAVTSRKAQRQRKLTAQLPGALGMLASALRSGYSLLRAMQVVAEEMAAPLSAEFHRVMDETAVGYSLDQSLNNLVHRTQSADIKLIVTAMQIQAQVGGNLAEILDKTAAIIRDRFQLAAEVSALTAEGRMSVSVLAGLPVGVAFIINLVNPGYMGPMFTDPLGRMMLAGAAVMLSSGLLIVKRMLAVKV